MLHELERPHESGTVEHEDGKAVGRNEVSEPCRADTPRAEQMERFGENGHCGLQRFADALEDRSAPLVLVVPRIEQGHQWARVDEDQRRCFLRMTSFTALELEVDGATA